MVFLSDLAVFLLQLLGPVIERAGLTNGINSERCGQFERTVSAAAEIGEAFFARPSGEGRRFRPDLY